MKHTINVLRWVAAMGVSFRYISAGYAWISCRMLSQNHTCSTVTGRSPNALSAFEHLPQLGAEAVVQPCIEEGVATGWAHGAEVAQQLDQQKVALVNEVDVDVPQHVEHMDWKPAHSEGGHQKGNQSEDLPLASLVDAYLILCPVARGNAFL